MNDPKEWFHHGYVVVPVDSQSVPVFSGIYDERYSEKDVDAWAKTWPGANLAVVCGKNDVVAFDVDVDDEYVATCLRRRLPYLIGGTVLMRRRAGSPRFAVLCRAGEGMEKIAAAHSDIYITPAFGDEKQQVEYKAERRVLTVAGFHRKDNSEYQVKRIPHVSELGVLTYPAYLQIMDAIHSYVRDGWRCVSEFRETLKRVRGSREKWASVDDVFPKENGLAEATIQRRPFTDEEIEDLLAETDGSIRENWLNVGICFWNLNNGAQADFDRWDTWCKQFSGYAGERDQKYHWGTFKYYKGMTFEVLERRIRNTKRKQENRTPQEEELERFRPKRLSEDEEYRRMLNTYVLIADGALIADMTKPPAESIRTIPQMREFSKAKKIFIEQRNAKGIVTQKAMPMFDFWLQDKDHIEAWGVDYVPGLGPLIPETYFKGRPQVYYNKYNPPLTMMVDSEKRVCTDMFHEHMEYLFPNGGDKWMLNWMAQLIQEPDKRMGRVSPFSISTYEGTGRGWLTELLVRLVGASNYATVKDITDIIRPSAKSGYLDGTVLLVVNEVYVKGRERYNLLSQVKTLLTDDKQEIDVKYGKHTYNQQIYTRVFFQSNYIDGLVIDEKDSRIQPFINTAPPRSRDYYNRLYALLEMDAFIDSVYSELKEYPIDYSLLQYSQDTPDRQKVIRSTKSPTALAFHEFHQVIGEDSLFTDEILDQFVLDYLQKIGVNGESTMVNQKALRFLRSQIDQNAVSFGNKVVKSFGVITVNSEEEVMEALRSTQKMVKDFFKSRGIRR